MEYPEYENFKDKSSHSSMVTTMIGGLILFFIYLLVSPFIYQAFHPEYKFKSWEDPNPNRDYKCTNIGKRLWLVTNNYNQDEKYIIKIP